MSGSELNIERVKALADGRVYTGESALKNGLIDQIGNYEDALKETAVMVGIKGDPQVVTPPKVREDFDPRSVDGRHQDRQFKPGKIA
ncbi:MAG: S49 family peptidase [Acidobacteria bacterium]|nr:S49 family peptidase [Acidobacteriota bacterium]